MQLRCPLLLHGHVHAARGVATLGAITIVNPGALVEGRYAAVTLAQTAEGKWKVEEVALRELPDM